MNSPNDKSVRYLTPIDLFNINDEVTGGEAIIRDVHLLNSAARRPMLELFGEAQFPTLLDKAAALLHSLAYHHLFIDGNKRTATRAVERFLRLNGYSPTWTDTDNREYLLEVAQGRHDVEAIAAWLAAHTTPTS
jgi:death-on-curing protein